MPDEISPSFNENSPDLSPGPSDSQAGGAADSDLSPAGAGGSLTDGGASESPAPHPLPAGKTENPAAAEAAESAPFYSFELGEALFKAGAFRRAIPHLETALRHFLRQKDSFSYFSCSAMLIMAKREIGEKINLKSLEKEFEKASGKKSLISPCRALGHSAYYDLFERESSPNGFKDAKKALRMALERHASAVKAQDYLREILAKMDVAICLYVYASCQYAAGDYKKCAADLDNLKVILEYYFNLKRDLQLRRAKTEDFQEQHLFRKMLEAAQKNFQFMQRMRLSVMMLEASMEWAVGKDYGRAEKILWECYEEASKTGNAYLAPYIFCYMSYNYYLKSDLEQASVFLNLAEKNADPDRRLFLKYLEKCRQKTGLGSRRGQARDYDIIFNEESRSVIEKYKGCVSLKNQFILVDTLKRLISSQGVPHSKRLLVEKIWKEEYRPAVHDNKIYVTIKRLRELLEPNVSRPRYICRSSAGYYLPKNVKILLKR